MTKLIDHKRKTVLQTPIKKKTATKIEEIFTSEPKDTYNARHSLFLKQFLNEFCQKENNKMLC